MLVDGAQVANFIGFGDLPADSACSGIESQALIHEALFLIVYAEQPKVDPIISDQQGAGAAHDHIFRGLVVPTLFPVRGIPGIDPCARDGRVYVRFGDSIDGAVLNGELLKTIVWFGCAPDGGARVGGRRVDRTHISGNRGTGHNIRELSIKGDWLVDDLIGWENTRPEKRAFCRIQGIETVFYPPIDDGMSQGQLPNGSVVIVPGITDLLPLSIFCRTKDSFHLAVIGPTE